jgi:hypothetical protein
MLADIQPSVTHQVTEIIQAFARIEKEQEHIVNQPKDTDNAEVRQASARIEKEQEHLINRLKDVVDRATRAVDTEANRSRYPQLRLRAVRILCGNGKKVPVEMIARAWEIPDTGYYMTDCGGGLITFPDEKRNQGDLVKYETFVLSIDSTTKHRYLRVVRRLAIIIEAANRTTREANGSAN